MNGQAPPSALESKIGLFWLNRLGIAMLVLGFAFLMMFSVQQFGPMHYFEHHLKILAGAVASAVLLFAGKKIGSKDERRWFGHGLAAGGWSLAYFTTYAAFYIPESKIITSLPLETGLLLAIALASLSWAVRAGSELLAILSIALAGISILFSEPGLVSDTSFLILAVLASILGNRQDWRKLFAFALGVCYLGHFYCSHSLLGTHIAGSDDLLSALFISFIWLSFSVGLGYSIRPGQTKDTFVTIITYANAALFTLGLSIFGKELQPTAVETIFAASGAVYLGMARWLMKRDQKVLSTVHFLLGLALVNGAKAIRFSGLDLLTLDVIQIWLLMALGTRFDIRAFRLFAYFLLCAFVSTWFNESNYFVNTTSPWSRALPYDKLGLVAVFAFAHLSHLCARQYGRTINNAKFDHSTIYFLAANLMFSLAAQHLVDANYVSLCYTLQAAVCLAFGLKFRDAIYLVVGLLCAARGLLDDIYTYKIWETAPLIVQVIIIYSLGLYTRHLAKTDDMTETRSIKVGALLIGTIILTVLLNAKVPSTYLSLSFGIEGLSLMAAAWMLKEKTLRAQAFAVIFILVSKLLFVDLANRGTLERIVSFIGAGVTLILSSYVYALGTNAFGGKQEKKDAEKKDAEKKHEMGSETESEARAEIEMESEAQAKVESASEMKTICE